jgi:diguanylate cyclase
VIQPSCTKAKTHIMLLYEFIPASIEQLVAARGAVPADTASGGGLYAAFALGVLASVFAWGGSHLLRPFTSRISAQLSARRAERRSPRTGAQVGPAASLAPATIGPAITKAVRSGELELHYQPKLDCRTMQMCGAEALARWTLPDGTPVPTDAFVEQAELVGGISELTLWGVAQALHDSQQLGLDLLGGPIFVNLSGKLITSGFTARLIDLIGQSSAFIGLEITETAVIANPEEALRCLHQLREQGIALAIDDYGVGVSSLSYLKQIPATELKIDKQFIQGMTRSNRDPLIVRSTIDLCHGLGMKVTAEGVEDAMTASLLRVMGCDTIQGYFVSKAINLPDLTRFIAEHASAMPHVPQILKAAGISEPK